ncbi:hypothetical protein M23134_03713 [Microscilla marina ATCC 23134]|uniref:Uncharacterized protein n=1 Tax=Microscilla marina ATCC 23134 TaxID=313606 RepID=A1ZXC4_MICM2|nr:hypothetical protein M23134_03713 [Microscilla marina ATCC 23134]
MQNPALYRFQSIISRWYSTLKNHIRSIIQKPVFVDFRNCNFILLTSHLFDFVFIVTRQPFLYSPHWVPVYISLCIVYISLIVYGVSPKISKMLCLGFRL